MPLFSPFFSIPSNFLLLHHNIILHLSRSFLLKKCQTFCLLQPEILAKQMKKNGKEVQISLAILHFYPNFFSKNGEGLEPIVLHTLNPMNCKKCVTSFSWMFHFSLIDFSKKIYDFFPQMPDALGLCGTMRKVKKEEISFWGNLASSAECQD